MSGGGLRAPPKVAVRNGRRHTIGAVSQTRPKSAEQEQRAVLEREANAQAAAEGRPLPFPNVWDRLDPTKVPSGASPAEIHTSYLRFAELCRPRARKRHRL